MELKELQRIQHKFDEERGWPSFPASLVYLHLIEELGEIAREILFEEGYKVGGLGHERNDDLEREFGQAFSLFLQLADRFKIDLEEAYLNELKHMEKRFSKEDWRKYMETYHR